MASARSPVACRKPTAELAIALFACAPPPAAHTLAPSKEAGPWALKLSQLYDDAALAKRKRNPRAKIRQTQAAQRLFNEYQITALRLRAKMTTEPLAMRCLAFPPSVGATGKGAGYRYLAMRDAGSDLSIVTAALNAFRLPIGAVCAIGVDMVSAWSRLPSSVGHAGAGLGRRPVCPARIATLRAQRRRCPHPLRIRVRLCHRPPAPFRPARCPRGPPTRHRARNLPNCRLMPCV